MKWKRRCQWGFLNFVPKVELGDLRFGEKKIILFPISPPLLDSEPKVFGPLEVWETHIRFEFQDADPKNGAWGEI